MATVPQKPSDRHLWLTVIVPFGIGYVVTMAVRSINAILAHPLEVDLHLSSTELGIITASYLIAFALVQIPLGILLDRWGARLTQSVFYAIAGLGIVLFGLGSHPLLLVVGRALVGVGTAGGLMAAFKAISEWVEQERIPFFNGIILGAGGLGALLATSPAKLFEVDFGWRAVCFVLGAALIGAGLLIFIVNRDRTDTAPPGLAEEVAGLGEIYRDRFFWHVTLILAVSLGGFIAVQGLWLGPWLNRVVGFSPVVSAHYLFALALAMTAGFLCGGLFAHLARRLGRPLTFVIGVGTAITIAAQALLVAGVGGQGVLLWVVYGFFAQVVFISYALIAQHFGRARAGRAVTAANVFVFLFAGLVQFGFGLIADLWASETGEAGLAEGYRAAFAVLTVLQFLALLWFCIQSMRLPGAAARS